MTTINPGLYKRALQWSRNNRGSWRPPLRPNHRDLTLKAVEQQEAVGHRVKDDRFALEKVEKDMQVLDLFIQQQSDDDPGPGGRRRVGGVDVDAYESDLRKIDTENIDDVMSMMNDCLAEKKRLQQERQRRKQQQQEEAQAALLAAEAAPESEEAGEENRGESLHLAAVTDGPLADPEAAPSPPLAPSKPKQERHKALPPPPMATPGVDYLEAPAETAQELAPGTDEEEGRRAGAEYDEPQPETAKGHSREDSSTTAIATETPHGETQGSGGVDSAATGGAASRKGGAKSGSTPGKGGKAASGPGSARSTRSGSTSFHPERLDCLKRHEEALRKRQEAVKKARDEEEQARHFKARPVPRCVREARWGSSMARQQLPLDYYYNFHQSGESEPSSSPAPRSDNGMAAHQGESAEWLGGPLSLPPGHGQGWPDEDGFMGMDGQASVMSFHGGGASLVSVGGVVEGTMLQRQREWEEAKERKLEQARALKELNELVEVQDKPEMVTRRGSWERAKLQAEEARFKALEQEREREQLEQLKQQVARAKYKALYTPAARKAGGNNGPTKRAPRRQRSDLHARKKGQEDESGDEEASESSPERAHRSWAVQGSQAQVDEHRGSREEEEGEEDEEFDEIELMNGPPTSAVYLSPSERRKRREEPFAQMLAEKPLNEVQRLLAEKFNLPGLQPQQTPSRASAPQAESASGSKRRSAASSGSMTGSRKGLKSSRLGSFESCVQAYTSMVVRPPEKVRSVGARRRPRVRSETAVSSLAGLDAILGLKPGSSCSGGNNKAWGKLDEESWRAIMSRTAEGLASSNGGSSSSRKLDGESAGQRVERRLQEVYDYGVDALKAVFSSNHSAAASGQASREEGPKDGRGAEEDGSRCDDDEEEEEDEDDDDGYSSAGSSTANTMSHGARQIVTGVQAAGPTVPAPSVEMSDDEISRLINQFTGPTAPVVDQSGLRASSQSSLAARSRVSVRDQLKNAMRPVAPSSMQPYERYEQGFVDYFFDPSSTTDKGRFRVYDARDFLPESMHRKNDPGSLVDGVTLLMGKTVDPPHTEKVITIMFDRKTFSIEDAQRWWDQNRERFIK